MVSIRRARAGDVGQMVDALVDAYHGNYSAAGEYYARQEMVDPNYETTSGPYYSRSMFVEENAKSIRSRLREPFRAFVLLDGKRIVGYIITEDHLGRTWINDTVIRRGYQSRGLGKRLFRHAARGKKEVYLWVNAKNPARDFWKREGFSEVLRECLMRKG